MKVARLYRFRARHSLPGVAGYDEPHWHDYTVEVVVSGQADHGNGMVVDTQRIDDAVEPWVERHESTDLNEAIGCSTVENLARYLRLQCFTLSGVEASVRVWEDDNRWGQAP